MPDDLTGFCAAMTAQATTATDIRERTSDAIRRRSATSGVVDAEELTRLARLSMETWWWQRAEAVTAASVTLAAAVEAVEHLIDEAAAAVHQPHDPGEPSPVAIALCLVRIDALMRFRLRATEIITAHTGRGTRPGR